jgi:hypothetical protein
VSTIQPLKGEIGEGCLMADWIAIVIAGVALVSIATAA